MTHSYNCNALQHIATRRISLCMTRLGHMWHDLFIGDMTHSYNCNALQHTAIHRIPLCVTRLGHMWHDLFIYGTWLIHIKVINVLLISPSFNAMAFTGFSSVWRDVFIRDMWHDSCLCGTWPINMKGIEMFLTSPSYKRTLFAWLIHMWHDSFFIWDVTHPCERYQLVSHYGVASISRLLKITGLFCRISSLL